MPAAMRDTAFLYWVTATPFSIFFGEFAGPLLARHPLPILIYPLPLVVYYAIVSGIFSLLVTRSARCALIVFFAYGIAAELFLFGTIGGVGDSAGILFFGLFYVFLFGTPVWISRWLAVRVYKDRP